MRKRRKNPPADLRRARFVASLDAWRGNLSRTEAIRRLVEIGLKVRGT
jgi:hypothetical protein